MRFGLSLVLMVWVAVYLNVAAIGWMVYYFWEEQIAYYYCENPTDPTCHGRCFVEKISEPAKGKENSAYPLPFLNFLERLDTVVTLFQGRWNVESEFAKRKFSLHECLVLPTGYPTEIDHPPKRLVLS